MKAGIFFKKIGRKAFFVLGLLGLCHPIFGQNGGPAVEQWRSFLPYSQINDLAYDAEEQTIYASTDYAMFSYNEADGSLETYSKVNGMHEIGMSGVAFDETTGTVVLTYENGNIDLFKNHTFSNIPYLKISQVTGDKTIYAVTTQQGTAYLSTGLGLVMVKIKQKEIKGTIPFYEGSIFSSVYDVVIDGSRIYAATGAGLFSSDTGNALLQDYASWEKLSNRVFRRLAMVQHLLYAGKEDSLFRYERGDPEALFYKTASAEITGMNAGPRGLWLCSYHSANREGKAYLLNHQGQKIDSLAALLSTVVLERPGGALWFNDRVEAPNPANGLRKRISPTESKSYTPDGPVTASSFEISAYDGQIWVAHGGHKENWNPTNNLSMVSLYHEQHWRNFSWLTDNPWYQDFIRVLYDPQTRHAYAGSLLGGLVDFNPDLSWTTYDSGALSPVIGSSALFSVSGLALDREGNLWIAQNGVEPELTVRTKEGAWIPMKTVTGNTPSAIAHSAADVVIDDYGQAWFRTVLGGGVIVYDPNGTPENTNDDRFRILKAGVGNGNLSSNEVLSLIKTQDGAIWIGTSDGISIVNCPGQVIDRQCEASLNPVKFDEFAAAHLFAGNMVTAMAVDGGNRKWIGTNNGVWLLGSDPKGYKVIYRFTAENSPLPSNNIRRINIDPKTGDVYFSTDQGFVSFRSTATEAPKVVHKKDLFIYPNPVPSGYSGMIAVKELPEGADVRFTDVAGKLVYRTTASGGQAVWDGGDYTGRKVQSGVYLIFVVGKEGTEKMTGKLIIHK